MEIKTTNEIVEYDYDTTPDRWSMSLKELPKFRKLNDKFSKKKWVAVDDILELINEYKPSGSSYIDKGIMDYIDQLKKRITSTQSTR